LRPASGREAIDRRHGIRDTGFHSSDGGARTYKVVGIGVERGVLLRIGGEEVWAEMERRTRKWQSAKR